MLFDRLSGAELVEPATCGTWSARDVMVHIANWEEELARILRALDGGRTPAPTYTVDEGIDAWDEARVVRFRAVPTPEARRYVEEAHAEAMRLAAASRIWDGSGWRRCTAAGIWRTSRRSVRG